MKIDQKDMAILKHLQENGRITNLELSQRIGLSPAPTLERVRKLEEKNYIMSYHANVNESALGIGIKALVRISLSRQKDNAIQSFVNQIQDIDEIVECHQVTGDYDYQLKIMVQDIPAFDRLISEKLSTIEEIGQMQTSVILNTVKSSKVLPLGYN